MNVLQQKVEKVIKNSDITSDESDLSFSSSCSSGNSVKLKKKKRYWTRFHLNSSSNRESGSDVKLSTIKRIKHRNMLANRRKCKNS